MALLALALAISGDAGGRWRRCNRALTDRVIINYFPDDREKGSTKTGYSNDLAAIRMMRRMGASCGPKILCFL